MNVTHLANNTRLEAIKRNLTIGPDTRCHHRRDDSEHTIAARLRQPTAASERLRCGEVGEKRTPSRDWPSITFSVYRKGRTQAVNARARRIGQSQVIARTVNTPSADPVPPALATSALILRELHNTQIEERFLTALPD
ncbi:hypothetical protein EVAR_91933_1 [Eumeta japonica]|uniref:Uncharacterized protein n=1 Tax=Eumeta variegata TaxID=151549 RepID=A0A4C1SSN1_EUMVA|nr:hypothetical protein EVAR_91933_1 [Eumeta japonica]